jgi:hypothetical protein
VICDEAALLYVTALVPVRVAFAVDVDLGSGAWMFDVAVDVYFITDLILNFRTAVWCRKNIFSQAIFILKTERFTKTGSGQTYDRKSWAKRMRVLMQAAQRNP